MSYVVAGGKYYNLETSQEIHKVSKNHGVEQEILYRSRKSNYFIAYIDRKETPLGGQPKVTARGITPEEVLSWMEENSTPLEIVKIYFPLEEG